MNFIKALKEVKRKGMSLIELLGVMIVMIILIGIAIGGISRARDMANQTSVMSDLRTFETSIKQMLMTHPEVMKYVYNKPTGAADQLIKLINEQTEEMWDFEPIGGTTDEYGTSITPNDKNGAIGTTTIKRDAWGNAYCLYVYFDDRTTTYPNKDGVQLVDSDSCVYLVIASPGKNSTGMGLGADGNNYDATSKKLLDPKKCVNNTDGVDDLGVIVRILNGDIYSATFGVENALLGSLKGTQWVLGLPDYSGSGGVLHNFDDSDASTTLSVSSSMYGGSIDLFYDHSAIEAKGKVTWVGGNQPVTATS